MSLAGRLSRLVPDLSETLARFPIPALISVLVFIYAQLDIADIVSDGGQPGNHVYLGGAAAFLAAGAAHYFAHGRNLAKLAEVALAVLAAIVVAGLAYWDTGLRTSHLFLFAALVPLLMISGFLRPDAKQGAIWLFNLRLGLAILLAIVVGLIFAGGVSAILESLKFLFEVSIPWRSHEHVWSTAAALIAPIYGLSLAPTNLDEEVTLAHTRDTLLERGVSVLVNYVMVPIAVIYTVILHAYAVKILLNGALPEGQIGVMVTVFALGGTATWLIAWPWRETGTWLLRFFMRYWFWFTIVPVILLAIAIWERISTYGVTPDRYGIVIVAVWLALVTLYLAIRRNQADMRVLLGSFALLVLVGSTGPWGANSVSVASQFERLIGYLQADKLLTPEGKVVDQPPRLSDVNRSEIDSLIWALNNMGGLDKLAPLFAGHKDDPFATGADKWDVFSKIRTAFGLDIYTPPPEQVTFASNTPITEDFVSQGRLIGPIMTIPGNGTVAAANPQATIDGDNLIIKIGDRRWLIPVKSFLEKVKAVPTASQQQPLAYDIDTELKLIITETSGTLGDKPTLYRAVFWIILRQ
ncbi:DUF4153 domain-containing protein [Taklimakanibacter lacteus]|uniref:DUF4153 domain-containing protein n=1 Tax=Taklimakanibacter lacteus TaxID=2268456 RepID=UPI000E66DDA6